MRTRLSAMALISAVALCGLTPADNFSILRVPKEGTTVKYTMNVDAEISGIHMLLTATVAEKVVSVDKDGNYTIEQTQVDASGTYNNEKIDIPPRGAVGLKYKANGVVTSISGDLVDPNFYRMENLGTIVAPNRPVGVNDMWTAPFKADKALGTVDATADYKVVAEEKIGDIDTLKIKATIREADSAKPAVNEFSEWVSKADGSMVQLEAKWTNAPFPGNAIPLNATVKMTRIVK